MAYPHNLIPAREMYTLGVIAVAVAALAWILYPKTHTDSLISEMNAGANVEAGIQDWFDETGGPALNEFELIPHRNLGLLDWMKSTDSRSEVVSKIRANPDKYPAYYWRIRDFSGVTFSELDFSDFDEDSDESPFASEENVRDMFSGFTLSFTQDGKLFQLRNPDSAVSGNLNWATLLDDETEDERSVVRFTETRTYTGQADESVWLLTRADLDQVTQKLISQTWYAPLEISETTFSFESSEDDQRATINVVFQDEEETGVRSVSFRYSSVHGLLGITPEWVGDSGNLTQSWNNPVGGVVIFLLSAFILIVFVRRYYLRILETRTALFDGLLAGAIGAFFTFTAVLKSGLYNNLDGIGFWLGITLGPVTVALGLIIIVFIISAAGASISHEAWPDKMVTINFTRRGFWFNKPVGQSLIYGFFTGLLMAGIIYILLFLLDNIPIQIGESRVWDGFAALLSGVSSQFAELFRALVVIWLVFLCYGAMVQNRFGSIRWIPPAALLVVLTLWNMGMPTLQEFNVMYGLMFIAAIGWIFLFFRTDALAVLSALIAFASFRFFMDAGLSAGWLSLAVLAILMVPAAILLTGWFAIKSTKGIYDLPEMIPDYILEHTRKQRIERELELAREIQYTFLPKTTSTFPGLDFATNCEPAFEIGGDYYDIIGIDENRLGVAVCDVSGKGIQAAFYMTLLKGFLASLCTIEKSPSKLMFRINDLFRKNAPRGTFITMIYGIYDKRDSSFTFSRAGHEPLLVSQNGVQRYLRPDGLAVGMAAPEIFDEKLKEEKIFLQDNDFVVLFTDGYSEARNRRGSFLGEDALIDMVQEGSSAAEIMKSLNNKVLHFMDTANRHDDMTMVILRKNGED